MTTKTCRDCDETKPVSEFSRRASAKDGLQSYCRACVRIRNQASHKANPRTEQKRAWWAANTERTRGYAQDWNERNPQRRLDLNSQYRARKLDATVEDVRTDVVLAAHGRWCYLCETAIGEDLHLDHVVPLARGGEHSYANIRPAHAHCNQSKKDQQLHELDLPFVPPHLLAVA